MKDILFVLKIFAVTLVVIILMQIKVGQFTMEEQAALFIQDSWFTVQVQHTATGLSKLLKDVSGGFGLKVSNLFGDSQKKSSRSSWNIERSSSYKSSQEKPSEKSTNVESAKAKVRIIADDEDGVDDANVRESQVH